MCRNDRYRRRVKTNTRTRSRSPCQVFTRAWVRSRYAPHGPLITLLHYGHKTACFTTPSQHILQMWRHVFFPECTYSTSYLCAKALYLYQKSSLIRTQCLKSLSLGTERESEFEVYKTWAVPKGRAFQSVIMRHPCGTPARRAENNICIIYMLETWLQTQRGISVLRISKQAKIVLHSVCYYTIWIYCDSLFLFKTHLFLIHLQCFVQLLYILSFF